MRHSPAHIHDPIELPKGIQRSRALPDDALGALWESIILDDALKSQLLSQAVLNFTLRPKVGRSVIPLHGVILLVGAPGTGKILSPAASRIASPSRSSPATSGCSRSRRTA